MKMKREIHALDYAVVELVSALEGLFRFAINPLELKIAGGLNIEKDIRSVYEVRVRIRPVSWPEGSQIFARFHKGGEDAWKAFKGNFIATHLPSEFSDFHFSCEWDMNGYYRFRGSGTSDQALFDRLLYAQAATKAKQH